MRTRKIETVECKPLVGYVTGYKFLCEGKVYIGDWEEGTSFTSVKKMRVVCFKRCLLGKEHYALEEDCSEIDHPEWKSWECPYGHKASEEKKAEIKKWYVIDERNGAYQRNGKGQWIKFKEELK